jgi:hypothetical protein
VRDGGDLCGCDVSILCAVPADLSDSDSLTRFRFLVFTGLIFGAHILSQERVLDL